jgi:hypothetical protein
MNRFLLIAFVLVAGCATKKPDVPAPVETRFLATVRSAAVASQPPPVGVVDGCALYQFVATNVDAFAAISPAVVERRFAANGCTVTVGQASITFSQWYNPSNVLVAGKPLCIRFQSCIALSQMPAPPITYSVERATDLVASNWLAIATSVVSNPTIVELADTFASTNKQCYFRMRFY